VEGTCVPKMLVLSPGSRFQLDPGDYNMPLARGPHKQNIAVKQH